MVLGKAGSGGQLQNMAGEGSLMGPLSSEFSRDSPSPSMCPLVVWEVEKEVVVMFGSGGVATGLPTAASLDQFPTLGRGWGGGTVFGRFHGKRLGIYSVALPTHPGHILRIYIIRTLLIHY